MSKPLIEFLEAEILPHYDSEDNSFAAHIQEEYLTSDGKYLDKGRICTKAGVRLSTATYRKVIKQVFGESEFTFNPFTECEVTQEDFNKVYVFGKYVHVTGWIEHFHKHYGKVLTSEKLFEYIANHKQPNNGIKFCTTGIRPVRQATEPYFKSRLFT